MCVAVTLLSTLCQGQRACAAEARRAWQAARNERRAKQAVQSQVHRADAPRRDRRRRDSADRASEPPARQESAELADAGAEPPEPVEEPEEDAQALGADEMYLVDDDYHEEELDVETGALGHGDVAEARAAGDGADEEAGDGPHPGDQEAQELHQGSASK